MATRELHDLTAAYALDALDEDERQAYEDHLRRCERCREELSRLGDTAALLAYGVPAPEPPAALRGRILDAARAERGRVIPFPSRRRVVYALGSVAAAAASVAIGLGVWAGSLSRDLDEAQRAIDVLADPAARSIALTGADGRLVLAPDGEAALVVAGLRPAPAGKTYEIWVIEGDRPRPAGLFDEADEPLLLERRVPADATVAVTVERDGGVQAPTRAPIVTARV